MERRIERSGFDLEELFRCPLDVLGDRVPVRGPEEERSEDQQVERALQQLDARRTASTHCVDSYTIA